METITKYYLENYILLDKKELYCITAIMKSLSISCEQEEIVKVVDKLPIEDYQASSIEKGSWYVYVTQNTTHSDWQSDKKEIESTTNVLVNTTQSPISERIYLTRQGVQHFISALEELYTTCPHFIPYAQFLVRYWGHYKPLAQKHMQQQQNPSTPKIPLS